VARQFLARHSWLIGLAVSVCCLVLVLSHINLAETGSALARLDWNLFWLPVVLTFLDLPLRPWRWQASFPGGQQPSFQDCFKVLAIGNLVNNLVPGRGGDLLRCFLLKHNRQPDAISASQVLATIGLEKLLDGLALSIAIWSAFLFLTPPAWVGKLGLLSGLVFGGATGLFILLYQAPEPIIRIIQTGFRRLNWPRAGQTIGTVLQKFATGLSVASSSSRLLVLIVLTSLIWLEEAAMVWAQALTLHIPLSLPASFLVVVILGLGLSIPAAPGFIGTYEVFSIAALKLFGISQANALALTLVMHIWAFFSSTVLGLICMGVSGTSLMRIMRLAPAQKSGEKL
jgi:glycosyltransferase 2 family protein